MKSILTVIAIVAVCLLGGCGSEDVGKEDGAEAPAPAEAPGETAGHHDATADEHHDEAEGDHSKEHSAHEAKDAEPLPPGANKMCPVLPDEKAEASFFVQYKDKRIYLCCKKCVKKVSRDPASWYAKAYADK